MPIMPWKCAHGAPAPVELDADNLVEIGEPDTNTIVITGSGVIYSFGLAPVSNIDGSGVPCTKLVIFKPAGGEIVLMHGPALAMLSNWNRTIDRMCIGSYFCNENGHWTESGFWETGDRETSRRFDLLEERLATLERVK